ncbi:hypothetical protein LCGC14_0468560 [marine sediment metagenome]|uniref:Uncharacterized protein n=1 Tax=marine sediment metagenome TaxID=412755 RepID=A0A0F9SCY7_9ZZZZ
MTKAKQEQTVERVVIGSKSFSAINPNTGERFSAKPGTKVTVTKSCADSFTHRLQSASIATAQAELAAAEAEVEVKDDEAAGEGGDAASAGGSEDDGASGAADEGAGGGSDES